ncbi:MAG: hypothetical protein ACO3SO_03255 [Luteolibacter sp.]
MANKDVQIGINRSESKEKPEGLAKAETTHSEAQAHEPIKARRRNQTLAQAQALKKFTSYMAVASLLVLLVIIVTFVIWSQKQPKQQADSDSGNAGDFAQSSGTTIQLFQDLEKNAALQRVDAALWVEDEAGVREYFHLGGAKEQDVLDFLAGLELPGKEDRALFWIGNPTHGSKAMLNVAFMWMRDGDLDKRLAILTPNTASKWKVDFEAFACICNPPWSEFLDGKVIDGEARVTFIEDRYFNGRFSDDKWICYALTSITSDVPIFGYCRPDSAQHRALEQIRRISMVNIIDSQAKKGLLRRAMVRLQRVEGDMANQFEIKRVLASDWVEEETPYDERFMTEE